MDSSDDETILSDIFSDPDTLGSVEPNQLDGPCSSHSLPVSSELASHVPTNHVSLGSFFYSVDGSKRVWWPYNSLVSTGIIQGRRKDHPAEWTAQADVFFGWLANVLTDACNQFVVSWPLVQSFFLTKPQIGLRKADLSNTASEIHVRTLFFSTGAILSCNLLSINYISSTGPQCEHSIHSLNATYTAISDLTLKAEPDDPARLQGCGWEILYSLFLLSDPTPQECLTFRLNIRKQVASNPQFWREDEALIGGQVICNTDLDGYVIDRLSKQCCQTEASFAALTLLLRVRGERKSHPFCVRLDKQNTHLLCKQGPLAISVTP